MFNWNKKDIQREKHYKNYPIGKKLNYLGKEVTITNNHLVLFAVGWTPYVRISYLNNLGEIQDKEFVGCEIEALKGK